MIKEFLEWRRRSTANEEAARKSGRFYLNKDSNWALLEKLIQEVNTDPDLAVLVQTADGTTLTLRSYPFNKEKNSVKNSFRRFEDDE